MGGSLRWLLVLLVAAGAPACRDRKVETAPAAPPSPPRPDDAATDGGAISALAFPGLAPSLATRMTIDDGVTVVELVRKADRWWLERPLRAEASEAAVRGALWELARCEWPTAAAPPIEASPTTSELAITVWQDDTIVADLRVGDRGTARLPADAAFRQLYRLSRYTFDRPLPNWRVRTLIQLDLESLERIEFATAGKTPVVLAAEPSASLRRLLAGTQGDDFVTAPSTPPAHQLTLITADGRETLSLHPPATVVTADGRALSVSPLIFSRLATPGAAPATAATGE